MGARLIFMPPWGECGLQGDDAAASARTHVAPGKPTGRLTEQRGGRYAGAVNKRSTHARGQVQSRACTRLDLTSQRARRYLAKEIFACAVPALRALSVAVMASVAAKAFLA